MDIQTLIFNALKDLVALGLTALLGFATAYVKSHFSAKQIDTAKGIAETAVSFVEQTMSTAGVDNSQKFQAAFNSAKALAAKAGIKLTDQQWESLIEGALKDMKVYWDSVGNTPSPAPAQTTK